MSEERKPYGLKEIAVDAFLGRVEYATPEERERRLDICRGCPRLNEALMQCKECGCFVKAKTKYKESSCPLGKW